MSAAVSFCIILVLITVSSMFASPVADCPESAAASGHDQPIIFDSTPPPTPNNDNIIPEAPLLLPPAHTAAAPIISYPDNGSIVPETPLIPSSNNNNIIAEAPLLSPPTTVTAAAPAEQTVIDGVQPLMQPSASTNPNESESESESEGGEQLAADNHQYKNTNTNAGFAGATRAIGGGVGAQPLVDNTPFDSASTTTYPFMAFSSCVALMILSIFI